MSREDDFKTRMVADSTLMAILTGGVFTRSEVGREGITRDSAPDAFDANGYVQPCALVKQRGLVPDGRIRDEETLVVSATQVIEIWLYEDSGYTNLDAARTRLGTLFVGHRFSDSFPVQWIHLIDREQEFGKLEGASLARMDFLVRTVEEF